MGLFFLCAPLFRLKKNNRGISAVVCGLNYSADGVTLMLKVSGVVFVSVNVYVYSVFTISVSPASYNPCATIEANTFAALHEEWRPLSASLLYVGLRSAFSSP